MWKGAVLLEDYTGQKELCAEDEDGHVSDTEDECINFHVVLTIVCHLLCPMLSWYLKLTLGPRFLGNHL